jgi:hypothetical protein
MAFIKLGDVIINTAYIVAIKVESSMVSGEPRVAVLMAAPVSRETDLASRPYGYEAIASSDEFSDGFYDWHSALPQRCQWLQFSGGMATALQDYFSSFNNVIDLTPPVRHSVLG